MKKILLSLLMVGAIQKSYAMQAAGGGNVQTGLVYVQFSDSSLSQLDLQRLRALNSGFLETTIFSNERFFTQEVGSQECPLILSDVFHNVDEFLQFERTLHGQLDGEIQDMVQFIKKANFLDINSERHLLELKTRDLNKFLDLCAELLSINSDFRILLESIYKSHGFTLLGEASRNGKIKLVELLIAAGTNVNQTGNGGWTALHYASRNGQTNIVLLLAAAHADINKTDNNGSTALHKAAELGHTNIVDQLIIAGANVNQADNYGWTTLHWAAYRNYPAIIDRLIAENVDLNQENNHGSTALYWAAESGHTNIVWQLIAVGADVNKADASGNTALTIAIANGHQAVAQLLQANGAR